jgi:hypothetical protein
LKHLDIAQELLQMEQLDQEMRTRNLEDDSWDDNLDRAHTKRMKELVALIGWPTISKVGPEGSHAAWLLVQHADHDVVFQRECLALMMAAPESEIERHDIAYLEDRVRVNSKQLQLYGTQFDVVDGTFIPMPIEEPDRVDERRRQMRLGTLQEAIADMYKKYHRE